MTCEQGLETSSTENSVWKHLNVWPFKCRTIFSSLSHVYFADSVGYTVTWPGLPGCWALHSNKMVVSLDQVLTSISNQLVTSTRLTYWPFFSPDFFYTYIWLSERYISISNQSWTTSTGTDWQKLLSHKAEVEGGAVLNWSRLCVLFSFYWI